MEKRYQIVNPQHTGNFDAQLTDCLQEIEGQSKTPWQPIKLTFFVSAPTDGDFVTQKESIDAATNNFFGDKCPTYAVISQPPLNHYQLMVEACFINTTDCSLAHKQLKNKKYVVATNGQHKELWASGLGSNHDSQATEASAGAAFSEAMQVLDAEGMTFDHIVRQWNYIAQILAMQATGENQYQHYQLFNEVRSKYYNQYRIAKGYPAATGIGTQSGGVIIDICAVVASKEEDVVAIDNPLQCLPYKYSQTLLEGDTLKGKSAKQPPQFERAKLVNNHHPGTIFVSGTAAIVGERTIGINDVDQQTNTTIHHIRQLLSIENLIFHRIEVPNMELDEKVVRVYIKSANDFEKVKAICDKSFNPSTTAFVLADVCRDNLLVEIEAEYAMQKH